MSLPFQSHPLQSHQPRKSVFVTGIKQEKAHCNFLNFLPPRGILICDEGPKSQKKLSSSSLKQQDMTATKLSKKSLKPHTKFTQFFTTTVKKEQNHIKGFQTKTQQRISNSIHQFSRQPSKVFSKTTSSELGYNLVKRPAAPNSQVSKFGQHSYKCSSQNIIDTSFQRGELSESCKFERKRLSHIPLVQSISKNSVQGMIGINNYKEVMPLMNPETFNLRNFQKAKPAVNIPQSFEFLNISPVKQMVILQVSERSGINSNNTRNNEELAMSKKTSFKAPPQFKKTISYEYSELIKTTPKKKDSDRIKQSMPLDIEFENSKEQEKPKILKYQQSKVNLEIEKKHFLEISFEKDEQQTLVKHKSNHQLMTKSDWKNVDYGLSQTEKLVQSCTDSLKSQNERMRQMCQYDQLGYSQISKTGKSNIKSTSSKVFSASGQEINTNQPENVKATESIIGSEQDRHEVLQSQIESSKSNLQRQDDNCRQNINPTSSNSLNVEAPGYGVESEQRIQQPKIKAPRLQHLPFGRHSVQIPKSKKFSGMKVRRTISMRDQEQSSQEETSQVIYGHRQTHKQAIIEEINEDMQESCVTRTEHNFANNINLTEFRQLLL